MAKTTTVATLGAALAERGQRVLLVDLDPQACLTFSIGIDPEDLDKSMHHVLLGGVQAREVLVAFEDGPDLMPATIELATAEVRLAREAGPEQVLRTALRPLRSSYDWIIVDCPPTPRTADGERAVRRVRRTDSVAVRDVGASWRRATT